MRVIVQYGSIRTVCMVAFNRYACNGRVSIELICVDGEYPGEPYTVASTNIVGAEMEPDEVAIKDYSENEGVMDALVKGGVVRQAHRLLQTGFVTVGACRLTAAAKAELKKADAAAAKRRKKEEKDGH